MTEICSGAVVFTEEDKSIKFLLLKSKTTGYWVFPKGHVIEPEKLIDTAKREVFEETGINTFEVHPRFQKTIEFVNVAGKRKKVAHYLFKTLNQHVKISEEHLDFRWLSFDDAHSLVDFENQKRILKSAWNIIRNERN